MKSNKNILLLCSGALLVKVVDYVLEVITSLASILSVVIFKQDYAYYFIFIPLFILCLFIEFSLLSKLNIISEKSFLRKVIQVFISVFVFVIIVKGLDMHYLLPYIEQTINDNQKFELFLANINLKIFMTIHYIAILIFALFKIKKE